jgi:GNAT superfamily N-acetyltransferase
MMEIVLRDAVPEDEEFLARLYCDVRRREVDAWGWPAEQQQLFLRMQFEAQRRSYRSGFLDAEDRIICRNGECIGRMLVSSEPAAMRLIDIALLEAHRNSGIGTGLLRELLRRCETEHCPLRLQVLQGNPAARLYQQLGFVPSSVDPMYVQMEWTPGTA